MFQLLRVQVNNDHLVRCYQLIKDHLTTCPPDTKHNFRGHIGGLAKCGTVSCGDSRCLEYLGVSYRTNISPLVSTRLNMDAVRWQENNDIQAFTHFLW
ncbi:hypothetical protein NPIL_679061 [Nephila pilipes]|uniref:Uncharacterized protein n=1 Tax=Nephila pilipes TaxID=299642 RepID=A0A8X6UEU8_NEPPI|nr:hypothetical protein NPIL_679061 [Nephila pilipes]